MNVCSGVFVNSLKYLLFVSVSVVYCRTAGDKKNNDNTQIDIATKRHNRIYSNNSMLVAYAGIMTFQLSV